MFRSLRSAWIGLVRQRTRAGLGILGVAAIGALLFDMLLLSRGLVVSFGELLDDLGFDVRVLATDAAPTTGPQLTDATALAAQVAELNEVELVLPLRIEDAEAEDGSQPARRVAFFGADPRVRSMWRLVSGRNVRAAGGGEQEAIVNRNLARRMGLELGSLISIRGRCGAGAAVPAVRFRVVGLAEFPFDSTTASTIAGSREDAARLCGGDGDDRAELLLVRSRPGAGALRTAAAIRAAVPGVYVVTNEELVERFSRVEFSYFRQISSVLSTVTLFFGFLLIAVLLTVSVNQRLGEIAALRALGLSRTRVVAGVLWESVLLVGLGGILALPLGLALSVWLDGILRGMPGLPAALRFFVFEARALALYAMLLALAAVAAAAYPMRIVAVLPIAETLRREVVS